MSRYKGWTSAKEAARLYPFVIEVMVPEGASIPSTLIKNVRVGTNSSIDKPDPLIL